MNPIIDKTTTGVAAGAVVSPFWLPSLADVSQAASLALTLLGIVWLLVQLYYKIRSER